MPFGFNSQGLSNNGDVLYGYSSSGPGQQQVGFSDLALDRIKTQGMQQRQLADLNNAFAGQQAGLGRDFQAGQAAAGRQFDWNSLLQGQGFQGQQADLTRQFQGGQAEAQRQQETATQQRQLDFTGTQNQATREFTGGQNEAQRTLESQLAGQTNQTNQRGQDLQFQAAQLPFNWSREVFGQVFPIIQGLMPIAGGGGGQAGFNSSFERVGGQSTSAPGLPSGDVYSPQMVNQQVNAGAASTAAGAAGQKHRLQEQMAGQGYGSRSPLAAALGVGIDSAAGAATTDQERQTRQQAAEANAARQLQVAQMGQQQWQQVNDQDIRRRQLAGNLSLGQMQSQNQLIQALLGAVR